MSIGLIGKKQGMTRFFTEKGEGIAVTVVSIEPNTITQIKTNDNEGYSSIQVTTGKKNDKHLNKPLLGHYKKSSITPGEGLWEFRTSEEEVQELRVGNSITLNQLENKDYVDVSGISKGKGFAGTVKRWNFSMQDATHGNSLSHRAPGSIGQCQTPGRVWKGKKMSGHRGQQRKTTQNLTVVSMDIEKNILLIKGSIPGSTGSTVVVRPSLKK